MRPWNANPSGFDSISNFMGEIPEPYLLVLLTRNRDSNLLAESNWDNALKLLGGESGEDDNGDLGPVQIVRHGHWACGWIEYLMIDSRNADVLALAESIEKRLKDYPILNEDDYSSRVLDGAFSYWESIPMSERVYECQRARVSVFAARRNHDLPDRLMERLEQIAEE